MNLSARCSVDHIPTLDVYNIVWGCMQELEEAD